MYVCLGVKANAAHRVRASGGPGAALHDDAFRGVVQPQSSVFRVVFLGKNTLNLCWQVMEQTDTELYRSLVRRLCSRYIKFVSRFFDSQWKFTAREN